jgi:MFS family permease
MIAVFNEVRRAHVNVRRLMLFTVLHNVSISIWFYACWSNYVFAVLGKSNTAVGWVSGANGIAEILAAIAAGWVSDVKITRLCMLRISMCTGLLALLALRISIEVQSIAVFCLAQAIYGAFLGTMLTSVESVFAAFVSQGNRCAIYSVKFALESGSQIVGGLMSIALFVFFGNQWSTGVLRAVMTAGLLIHASAVLMCLITITNAAPEAEDPLPEAKNDDDDSAEVDGADPVEHTAPLPSWRSSTVCCIAAAVQPHHLPYIVAVHDTILVLGSGLTTMFFPLFMREDYGASPVVLTCLSIGSSIATSSFAIVSERLAKLWRSRVAALLFFKVMGSLALLWMALARNTALASLWSMCVVYMFRYGCMNCSSGLTRALIMDHVPEAQRGRWNAVESMQSAAWSGTSVLGGVLADRHGYGVSFFFTFAFHAFASALLATGLWTPDVPGTAAAVADGVVEETSEMVPATS